MEAQYNSRSPAVKRLMREAQELREPTEDFYAQPLEDNLFEWHFTVRGPRDTEFDAGVYHGRIILPPEYPMKPPSIILLTPNGRFELHKKVCLSISGHHPESWQPSWSIRTALLAIIGFMPTPGQGAIGSLDYSADERKKLAKKSMEWTCPVCGSVKDILRPRTPHVKPATSETGARSKNSFVPAQTETEREISEIVSQMTLKAEPEDVLLPVTSAVPDDQDEVEATRSQHATPGGHALPTPVPSSESVPCDSELRQRRPEEPPPPIPVRRSLDPEPDVPLRQVVVNSGPVTWDYVRPVLYYATIALISVAMLLLLCLRAAKQTVLTS